jgi:protein involved in polysaccharide export with SLBB domain
MSPTVRRLSLALALWAIMAPGLTGCMASGTDKRILQYLNQEGFGKRYAGNSQDQNYVTIGDTITFVDTYNPTEVRGTVQVDIDGSILIPDAGAVFVAGMTRSELESFLTQKLSPYWVQTDIKVEIRTGGARVYYVWGEVNSGGVKRFLGDTTVFEAVLAAQPTEHTSNLGRVKLIRADPRNPLVIPVNVADMWRSGDSTYNVSLQEFDIIYVPPTVLKQLANFISAIIVPIISPFRALFQAIFYFENPGSFPGRGRNRGVF